VEAEQLDDDISNTRCVVLEGMYAPGRKSSASARPTEEQANSCNFNLGPNQRNSCNFNLLATSQWQGFVNSTSWRHCSLAKTRSFPLFVSAKTHTISITSDIRSVFSLSVLLSASKYAIALSAENHRLGSSLIWALLHSQELPV
jgi:hypothetical protein